MPKYRSLAVQLLLLHCLVEVENHDRRQPRNGTCLQDWLVAQGVLPLEAESNLGKWKKGQPVPLLIPCTRDVAAVRDIPYLLR